MNVENISMNTRRLMKRITTKKKKSMLHNSVQKEAKNWKLKESESKLVVARAQGGRKGKRQLLHMDFLS